MSDDFAELQALFCLHVEKEARALAEERCRAWRGMSFEEFHSKEPDSAGRSIWEAWGNVATHTIMRLLDGCSIANAKNILNDAASGFDAYHKVQAENIPHLNKADVSPVKASE